MGRWVEDLTLYLLVFHLLMTFANSFDPELTKCRPGPEVIKKIFMLNSTEHEIHPAHKCKNANNCWHFNIY